MGVRSPAGILLSPASGTLPPHRLRERRDLAYWLLKTEPDCYAWDDLVRDKAAVWDGISNALALKHLRAMKKGDLALVYHTGDERSAVGDVRDDIERGDQETPE